MALKKSPIPLICKRERVIGNIDGRMSIHRSTRVMAGWKTSGRMTDLQPRFCRGFQSTSIFISLLCFYLFLEIYFSFIIFAYVIVGDLAIVMINLFF